MARYIDADALLKEFANMEVRTNSEKKTDMAFKQGVNWVLHTVVPSEIGDAPTIDVVPTDFHDRCMQAEIQKCIRLKKIARLMCEGYLDMPSGCDGCPLVDTMEEDDEGNGVCDLFRM